MRGSIKTCLLGIVAALAVLPSTAVADSTASDGGVYARVSGAEVVLGNELVERRWSADPFLTTAMTDKRGAGETWSSDHRDFSLGLAAAEIGSESFTMRSAAIEHLDRGGLRVTMNLIPGPAADLPEVVTLTRVAEAYPGVAGFRTQTTINSEAPLALTAATLEEAAIGADAAATITRPSRRRRLARARIRGAAAAVRGCAQPVIGDAHAGTWRDSRSAAAGEAIEGPAQWISTARRRAVAVHGDGAQRPALVARRATTARPPRVRVDYEPRRHQPRPASRSRPTSRTRCRRSCRAARPAGSDRPAGRAVRARGGVHRLRGPPGDEPWQFHKYLTRHRLVPYDRDVTFNSNGTDGERDLDRRQGRHGLRDGPARSRRSRRQLGIDTFILDDGWQAISGDW